MPASDADLVGLAGMAESDGAGGADDVGADAVVGVGVSVAGVALGGGFPESVVRGDGQGVTSGERAERLAATLSATPGDGPRCLETPCPRCLQDWRIDNPAAIGAFHRAVQVTLVGK